MAAISNKAQRMGQWEEDEDKWGDVSDLLQAVREQEREEQLEEARKKKEECLRRLTLKKMCLVKAQAKAKQFQKKFALDVADYIIVEILNCVDFTFLF